MLAQLLSFVGQRLVDSLTIRLSWVHLYLLMHPRVVQITEGMVRPPAYFSFFPQLGHQHRPVTSFGSRLAFLPQWDHSSIFRRIWRNSPCEIERIV